LRRALEIGAAPGDKAFFLRDRATAGGTLPADVIEQRESFRIRGSLLQNHLHHRRNDLARLLHHHGVADPHILALDLLLVVKRGAGNGGPGNEDRLQLGHRRKHASAADLNGDILEQRLLLLRQKLVGGSPSWCARGVAQLVALRTVQHLHHRAIGPVAEFVSLHIDLPHGIQQLIKRARDPDRLVPRDTHPV
jgi:hypothetical protein